MVDYQAQQESMPHVERFMHNVEVAVQGNEHLDLNGMIYAGIEHYAEDDDIKGMHMLLDVYVTEDHNFVILPLISIGTDLQVDVTTLTFHYNPNIFFHSTNLYVD